MRASLVLATLATIAAGCSLPSPKPPVSVPGIEVRRIERLRWDEPPQPNLFRVDFSPELTSGIRSRAQQEQSGLDVIRAELYEMERLADNEFRARNLCASGAQMISVVDGTANAPSLAGFFRCAPKGLF